MNDYFGKFVRHIIFIVGVSSLPALAQAAGLGSLSVYSYLGQNLNGEIKLLASPDEVTNLTAKIASPEAFERAGIPFSPALTSIRAALNKRGDGTVVVKLTSTAPVNDPYVELLVELTWPQGQIVRQFTFLLDPPSQTKSTAAEEVTVPDNEYPPTVPAEKTNTKSADVTNTDKAENADTKSTDTANQGDAADTTGEGAEGSAAPDSGGKPADGSAANKPAAGSTAPSSKTKKPTSQNGEIVVQRGDNLYAIAKNLSAPEDVTLEQVMVALYRANKRQFINNNINLIRAGKTLVVPSNEDYYAVSSKEARQTIQSQTADFREYQATVAGAPMPILPKDVTPTVSGTVRGAVNDRGAVVSAGGDKLQVAQSSPSAQNLNSLREELASKNRALQEAQSKINELEKILQENNKLLKLQGGTPATSSTASGAKSATPPTSPTPAPPPAPAPLVPPPVSTAPAAPTTSTTATTTTQSVVAASTTGAATVPVPPKPKPRPTPPPPKGFFSSLLDDSSSLVYAGLLLLVLLAGYFGFKFYRNRSAQSAGHIVEEDEERPMKSRSKKKLINSEKLAQTTENPAVDENFMDPLAEAESYLAFGHGEQAVQVLQEALDKEPNQVDYQLKLLEIFSTANDKSRFNSLAMDLFASSGGKGLAWNSAVEMGRKLDPSNTLYQEKAPSPAPRPTEPPKPPPQPAAPPPVAPRVAAATAPISKAAIEEKPINTLQTPGDLSRMVQLATTPPLTPVDTLVGAKIPKIPDVSPPPQIEGQPTDTLDLDFEQMSQPGGDLDFDFQSNTQPAADTAAADSVDLDLTVQTQEGASEDALLVGSASGAVDIDMDLDFEAMSKPLLDEPTDVDLDVSSASDLHLSALSSHPPIAQTAGSDQKAERSALDLEASSGLLLPDISLDLPPARSPNDPHAIPPKPASTDENLMLTLDLPHTPAMKAREPEAHTATVLVKKEKIEPLSISVDPTSRPHETHDASVINTKLELVKAYEAMGNKEGAKELLEEVLKDGTPEQQKLAKSLLTKLS